MPPRPLSSVLVANRGEIALRIIRSARTMGLRTVAVFVDADADALHVTAADEAVRLTSTDATGGSYLDGDAVIDAARRVDADAIHPGYGFLSENAEFATAVVDAGIVWVGPSPDAIAAMGDKLAAKRIAADADVPLLPSSEDPTDAASVGYPLIVKAAAGGGGKGMRLVEGPDELTDAVAAARREAEAGFGDPTVFLERCLPRSRHVEIQILGDHHGALVHLGERECSIQRRHQKIIEEAPSPSVDAALRADMGAAAVRLAAAIGYASAGTVEFLLDDDTGDYFFLEVNTRLQVEHPVTEAVTGIDLVREQLRIAAGEPLGYGQADITVTGHAIEARLYAEDPAVGFLPATGTLIAFDPAASPAVRWDTGVGPGTAVGLGFDPMLAKVIAHRPTRAEAAGALALALDGLHIGGVTTNRGFLAATLRADEFLAGATTTDFIDRVAPGTGEASDRELERAAVIAALWLQAEHRAEAPVLQGLPSGWRNARLPPQRVALAHGDRVRTVRYAARRDAGFDVVVDDESASDEVDSPGVDQVVTVHLVDRHDDGAMSERAAHGSIDIEIDGHRSLVRVTHHSDAIVVSGPRGPIELQVVPRFVRPGDAGAGAGGLVAPMPGVVLAVEVEAGQAVTAGQLLAILEAMKMEHRIEAPGPGTVTDVLVAVGDQVQAGDALLVLNDADADPRG